MGRPKTPGTRPLVLAADYYPLYGLHPQAQDQAPCYGLGSTHPGDCSQRRLITAPSSPLMSITGLSSVISECMDGHSPLLNSLETRADGTPLLFQIEASGPIPRGARDAAVIGIAIFGCVVWSHGTCGIQTGLCVSADYIWPELRRFSVHPPAYALS